MQPELRDWYLSTMGVVQYRLRGSTRTSPPDLSRHSDIPEQKTSLSPPQRPLVTGGDKPDNDATAMLKSLVAEQPGITSGPAEASAPVEEGPVVRGGEKVEASVAFRLACWRPSEDLLVIDSWPREPDQESQRLQLLTNLLKSIHRKPDQLPAPEFIDWPISGEASLPAASAYLTMFVKGRYQQAPFRWLLAMGEDAGMCLGHTSGTPETAPSPKLITGVEVIYTHSLTQMIEQPACKREVWQAIRFLSA